MFVYGTLMVPEIMKRVVGRVPPSVAALLPGYRRYRVPGEAYPAIVAAVDFQVDGLCYQGLNRHELELLDAYEGDSYVRTPVELLVAGRVQRDECYVARPGDESLPSLEPWELEEFLAVHYNQFMSAHFGVR
jgi:gamma-glutamylcyclotransferase (GGCT)/AIG2-like uncharacterized protein YtfP